jgi:replicative DNA helicase
MFIPKDATLEKCVLGGLLLSGSTLVNVLTKEDFTESLNKKAFEIIQVSLNKNDPIDMMILANKLGNMENKGEYVTSLISACPSIALIEQHITALRNITIKRELLFKAEEIKGLVSASDKTGQDLKNDAMGLIAGIRNVKNDKESGDIVSCLWGAIESIEKQRSMGDNTKLYTELKQLDTALAGLHKEELTILAARPSIGKTALSLQLSLTLAQKQNRVLFFSLEMSKESLVKRLISNVSGIDGHKLRLPHLLKKEDMDKIQQASIGLSETGLVIIDKVRDAVGIRSACREMAESKGIDAVFIDYLQLINSPSYRDGRERQIADISRALKELSMEFKIPVICLSQLNRKAEEIDRPNLSHLRESGAIEQDADNVIFLNIPKGEDVASAVFPIELIIAKQRNGPVGVVHVAYQRKNFKFFNLEDMVR